MVETGEGKGLPRATFNYHLFCRNAGRKRAVSSHLCYHKIVRNMRIKALLRANYNYHKIEEMGGKGAASNHPVV
jgi:hypothetical protein